MIKQISRACVAALFFSLLWTSKAAACYVCLNLGGACPYRCHSEPGQSGAVYCTEACDSYCIMSGSCQPFGPQSIEADGTALEPPTTLETAFAQTRMIAPPFGVISSLRSILSERQTATGFVRWNCRGSIVARVASESSTEEIHLQARQIVV
jgi:hypothetical protein